MLKKSEGIKIKSNITTMAFGSSHMEWGFIPQEGEYNFASASQDLYYSYSLYRLFNSSNVKNIFVTFSVFSPNDMLIKSGLAGICTSLKLLYGIDYQDEAIAKKKGLYKLENIYQKEIAKRRKKLDLPENYCGGANYSQLKPKQDVEEIHKRALAHYKINQKTSNQMDFCLKFLQETKENKQNLYFILPPAHQMYKEVLPSSDKIFSSLYELCKQFSHVQILNLYDSKEFFDSDFTDGDHLNQTGAIKMTEIMRNAIKAETTCER